MTHLLTWGAATHGQLGHGRKQRAPVSQPTNVATLAGRPLGGLSCGDFHSAVVAASPEAGLSDVHVVVVGEPMPVVGGARVAGPSLDEPPVIDIVRVLKHELGLERGEESLLATVDAACSELGIAMEGTLRERADACWRALNCPAASAVERRPSCGPVA